jgi:hypothetical protein
MLICYIRELGGNFHHYVNKVMEIVVPLLKFYFHDEVRYAASSAIPLLFTSLTKASYQRDVVLSAWHTVAAKIIEAANVEPDPAFLSHLLITFYDVSFECLKMRWGFNTQILIVMCRQCKWLEK